MRRAFLAVGVAALIGTAGAARPTSPAPSLLDYTTVVDVTLEAPFREILAGAPLASGDTGQGSVSGTLTYADPEQGAIVTVRGVHVSVRGNSSRIESECSFPKLALTFDAADRQSTALDDLDALKIGTHCADRGGDALTPRYGRLANQRSPHRESLVYDMLRAAGVTTLRTRPARITYIGTDARTTRLTRNALLIEDDRDAMKRLGGVADLDAHTFGSARQRFSVADTARVVFAQALIGNFDWCLRIAPDDVYRCNARQPLWNVHAFARYGQTALPVVYDFDLAGPVVGRHIWFDEVFDASFAASGSPIDVEVLAQLQHARSVLSREVLEATRRTFEDAKAAVYAAIESAPVDEAGRRLARQYADAFYGIVGDDSRFYSPVIVDSGHTAFARNDAATPACGANSEVPVGTPVGPVLERRRDLVLLRLLDASWHWTGTRRCDVVHRQPVWIRAAAIATDYPRSIASAASLADARRHPIRDGRARAGAPTTARERK
ncbi:MAG: hypothetical protein AB7Q29_03485 [Vicinamibacterales bacterium]